MGGSLVEAMIALCIVNLATLLGYSWVVFRADRLPFLRGFLISIRPMIAAFAMAVAVRLLLDFYGALIPSAVLQVLIGTAIGGLIYLVLMLLVERPLLAKLYGMIRKRNASSSVAAAAE
jgi:succinoglycan exporter